MSPFIKRKKNYIKIFWKNNRLLIITLAIIVNVLIFIIKFILLKNLDNSQDNWINANEKVLNFSLELLKILGIVAVGFFSFIRFFYGHVSRSTFVLDLQCNSVQLEDEVVHHIIITVKNNGPFTDYNPLIVLTHSGYILKQEQSVTIWPGRKIGKRNRIHYPNTETHYYSTITYPLKEKLVFFKVEAHVRKKETILTQELIQKNSEKDVRKIS